MALPAGTVWELRTAGSDLNGGGFVAGATGIDYSQQNAKNTVGNNISTTDAVTAASTTLVSATATFTADIVGNIIYLQGGSGTLTAGWYYVSAFTNSTTVTIDRNPGVSTGVTMNIGGALATLTKLTALWIASNKAFVKADGTYAPTATVSFTPNVAAPPDTPPNQLIGYTTTRTDNGKATIQATTNTGITVLNCGQGYWIRNFIVDGNNLGTSTCIIVGAASSVYNCIAKNFKSAGISIATGCVVAFCEVTGGGSAAAAAINGLSGSIVRGNWVHDNACPGIVTGSSSTNNIIEFNVVTNNTGASSDGIQHAYYTLVSNNTVYGNGRDGIRNLNHYLIGCIVRNNILVNNGGYGINQSGTPANIAHPLWDGNAFYNNTSGARNNIDSTTSSSSINNGVSPYTNVFDVTLTGVPFTNAGSNDYSLNNVTGQGAACRAAGTPGAFQTGTFIGYIDMGAVQHADPAGTASAFPVKVNIYSDSVQL